MTDVVKVVVEVPTINVEVGPADPLKVEVGVQGPPGPPGPEGGSGLTHTAGVSLGGHRAVVLNAAEEAIYADNTTLTHADKVLGITTGAVTAGQAASIRTTGEITEPSWAWALDQAIFLGVDGMLTQTPPSSGFLLVMGFPISATKMFLAIGEPTIL